MVSQSAVGLEALNCDLKKYYVANKHKNLSRVTPLVRSQIIATEPGYPFLKAKAAQTRHLAEFGLILASVHKFGCDGREPFRFKESSALAPHIGRHLDLLVDMFLGMVRYLRALSAEPFAVQAYCQEMYLYLQSLAGLQQLWRTGIPEDDQSGLPFVLRPKSHIMQHLIEEQIERFGSPAQFWCYRDEDFVGSVKTIAGKTLHPATLEVRTMQKLRILESLGARA